MEKVVIITLLYLQSLMYIVISQNNFSAMIFKNIILLEVNVGQEVGKVCYRCCG